MARVFVAWLVLLLSVSWASGLETLNSVDDPSTGKKDSRTFFVVDLGGSTTGSQTVTSTTSLNTTLLGYALLGLLLLGTLAALGFYFFAAVDDTTGSSGGYYRSMPGDSFDFSHLNILDWISMAEEMYRNYDTKNSDCYKRLICETYKNKKLGGVARTLDTAARWISFLEIIRYSDLFSEFFDEARDAIDRGKGSDRCSELYDTCDFSLSRIMHKYFDHNNIGDEQNVEYL